MIWRNGGGGGGAPNRSSCTKLNTMCNNNDVTGEPRDVNFRTEDMKTGVWFT